MTTSPKNARILIYDIETMAERGWFWPPGYETNIMHVDHPTHLLSFAWKWLNEPRTYVLGLDDFKGYNKDKHDDKALVTRLNGLMREADIIVGHNNKQFDDKTVGGRFVFHELPPVPPYKVVDTKQAAKRIGRFSSNKLDDLGELFGIGRKVKHGDFETLWIGCDTGDKKAWKVMKKYNRQDVILDEKLYLRLRPYIPNHPSLAMYEGAEACPSCGLGPLQKRGFAYSGSQVYQQVACQNCRSWHRVRLAEKKEKPVYV